MLNNLLTKFRGKRKNPFPQTKHIIKPAFEVAGVQYFEFDDLLNLPFKRGLKFVSIYNELDMKCDRFYLQKHTEAMKALLAKPRITLAEMAQISALNLQLEERISWIFHEDLIYKVASVVFFDANENPDDWEWKYASKKIQFWKENEGVEAFFLHEPIQRLIPFLKDSVANIHEYSQTQKHLDQAQLENIYTNLSNNQNATLPGYTQRYFSAEMSQS